ncbi:hypothetical protein JGUZn3_21450 [Entomobacter blattae]|uniref:Uncharacterized protein n=1 Tax=Entomobacter blattae TaxID=2762277 RepID=A0A7H1NU88_9PROT|nr:hypothetical protein JGUZn3_21450 [Entomobacter blattae]
MQTQDATKAVKTDAAMAKSTTVQPAEKQAIINMLEKGEY